MRQRGVAAALIALLFIGLALVWLAGERTTRGEPGLVAAAEFPARDLYIRAADGVRLASTYRPGRRPDSPAILFLHEVGGSREIAARNAEWFASQGYATLAIDFRGHGGSSMRPRSFGWHEALDAHAAFHWLKRRQQGAKIAVIGVSMGGAASLLGRSGPVPADALVLQAVYPDMGRAIRNRIADRLGSALAMLLEPLLALQARPRIGIPLSELSPLAHIVNYRRPVLVIGGMEDRYTPPADTRALYDAAPADRELWLIPDGNHAEICSLDGAAYRRRVLAFIRRTIGVA